MAALSVYFRQAEVRSLLLLLSSILLPILSAFSILIPSALWVGLKSNAFFLAVYFLVFIALMRWFARGGQYPAIHTMNLEGKTFLITGSAGGIGKQTALELVKRGARVVLFARSSNLDKTIDDVSKAARNPDDVTGYALDLSDLRSVKACADEFLKRESKDRKITALINNAGVMACPFSKSKDGLELQMATNHFGHFYLTKLLLPRLHSARIVNVSSAAHVMWPVPCDAAHYAEMCNPNTYRPWRAYSLTKSANIIFTRELQRRYSASHQIRAYSLHPGSVNTDLDRHIGLSNLIRQLIHPLRLLIFKSPLEGAQTNLYCALSDDAVPGEYHSDCSFIPVFHKYAKDDEVARQWWDYSEQVINEKVKDIEQN